MAVLSLAQREDTCPETLESTRPSRAEIPGHIGHYRYNAGPSPAMQPRQMGKIPEIGQAARIPSSDRRRLAIYLALASGRAEPARCRRPRDLQRTCRPAGAE